MRKTILLLGLFIGSLGFAQKKYPSLLWEIQKQGQRPSYLYGTMHVSERIAFHLSDVFFEKLLETDKVALESNPEFWLDEMQENPGDLYMLMNPFGYGNFYGGFSLKPLETEQLRQSFFMYNFMLNGILYRTYASFEDYQEDTYLDMFIFQTGKRTNREIVSLENYKESRELAEKAMFANQNFEPPVWAKKMMMEKPLQVLMENAYRDKDLDMIDSISRGMNSPKYNENMLFKRNKNMVHRMDSIFQRGETLFIGIGAAHLPGKEGVIELLREKGYTVKPIIGEYTQKGKNEKERLDHNFNYVPYEKHATSDQFLSMPSPTKFYGFNLSDFDISFSPDLQNGAYINLVRLNKNDFLRKNNYKSGLEKVDSLLFENIPGKILRKEKININGFEGFDISNKTKDGDTQRYWILSTPLEYLIISMVGKNEFVENQSKSMKNSLEIPPLSTKWKETTSVRGGFLVQMPEFQIILANDPKMSWMSDPQISAYDPSDDSYYFLIEKTVNDVDFLEETEFELKRMHYEFYKNLKIDSTKGKLEKNPMSFTSQAKLTPQKNLYLKSVINGSHYYLLGTTGNEAKANQFFNSFQLKKPNYFNEPKVFKDSILNFTVKTPIIPQKSEIDYESFNKPYNSQYLNHFAGKDLTRNFPSETNQNILVNYREFNRYDYYENVDSLWNEIVKNNEKTFKLNVLQKSVSKRENGDNQLEILFHNQESEQIVKARYITNGKYFYSIKTLLNKGYKNEDPFVEEFYNSFNPLPNKVQKSVFEPKIDLFLEDVNSSEDSIRESAFKSIYQIKFKDEDFPKLVNFLEKYDFKEKEEKYRTDLIQKIGSLKHKDADAFLRKYYHKDSNDSKTQIAVLESYASKKEEEDFQAIAKLLEEDIPISNYPSYLDSLFIKLKEEGDKTSKIFEKLMAFRTIPEYQNQLITLASNLLDSGKIKTQQLKPFQKDILFLGRLELKRSMSAWLENKRNEKNYYTESGNYFSKLKKYLTLLQPFADDKETQEFLNDVDNLQIPELLLYSLNQKLVNKDQVPLGLIEKIAEDKTKHWELYQVLKKNKKQNLLPKSVNKISIAESLVMKSMYNFDKTKDSLESLTMRKANYKDKNYEVYFFKAKTKNLYTNMDRTTIQPIAFELDKDQSFKSENNDYFIGQSSEYIDEEYLEETLKTEIDRVLFRDKKRVEFDMYFMPGMFGY